jgi:hypothetical protein
MANALLVPLLGECSMHTSVCALNDSTMQNTVRRPAAEFLKQGQTWLWPCSWKKGLIHVLPVLLQCLQAGSSVMTAEQGCRPWCHWQPSALQMSQTAVAQLPS